MPLTETATMPADEVMQDDWLEVGGHTFRVSEIVTKRDRVELTLYTPGDDHLSAYLWVARKQPIKVFNQKNG